MADARVAMDRMYRRQRHIYDLTRKFYLLGRDRLIADLEVAAGDRVCEVGCGTARNLIALAWAENGFRHLTNSRRAVGTPDDLKGLKVRTMENQVHMKAFTTLGALPTPMAFSELVPALQQGTVDGQENPIPVIVGNNLNQVQKYLSLTGHVYSPAVVLMSPATFGKLSKADQDMLREVGKVGAKATRDKVTEVETSGVDELRKRGMEVTTSVDMARFQTVLTPAFADFGREFGADRIQRIRDWK